MQILINIPDTLPREEIDQIIARIESQLQTETYSIKLEGILSPNAALTQGQGIQKFLDWSDRHPYSLQSDGIPSREERNAR